MCGSLISNLMAGLCLKKFFFGAMGPLGCSGFAALDFDEMLDVILEE